MEHSDQNDQDENVVETPVKPSAGDRLRSAREARDMSIKDVAAQTRQSVELLKAIEDMAIDHVSPTILRLQVNTYAQFLGLPGAAMASEYCETRSTPNSAAMPLEKLRSGRKDNVRKLWPIAAAAAIIIVGGVSYMALQSAPSAPEQAPIATKSIRVPLPSRAAALPQKTAASPEISIRATKTAWIEVRGSDGTIFRSRNMSKGEVYYPRMGAAWTVTVRDAGAFEWWLGGYRVGTLGEPSVPVYSVSVDAATAQGLEQASTALADIERADRAPR